MFESMDTLTDAQAYGRRPKSHPISTPGAFGSGELKNLVLASDSSNQQALVLDKRFQ